MTYINRNLLSKIETLLKIFPVVLILGARQTGKTTLAKLCRPDWKYFDLEKGSDYDFITRDFDFFFGEYSQHIIIDEAQQCNQLFRELRGVIDADRKQKNRFILTGSSSPDLLKGVSDSLAGRVGLIELSTLKVNELRKQELPSFYNIFNQLINKDTISLLKNLPHSQYDCLNNMLHGGYPDPVLDYSEIAMWLQIILKQALIIKFHFGYLVFYIRFKFYHLVKI